MKGIEDLVEINDPAMIYIREMLEQADRPYDLLPPSPKKHQCPRTATGNDQVDFGRYSI